MLAPLTTRPQQHMCVHDKNQLLKSRNKPLSPSFWRVCLNPRDAASTKMQVHNITYRLIISPNFEFLALMVLLSLALKNSGGVVPPNYVKFLSLKYLLILIKIRALAYDN